MTETLLAEAPAEMRARSEARAAEREIFALVTAALASADTDTRRAEAISDNRHLWLELAADVAGAANRLPAELRARIFYLSQFVTHQSRKVLRGSAGIDTLIEINAAMISALGAPKAA